MKADAETYALAFVGAAQGFWRYYVRPELTAERAWLGLGAAILAYEIAAPENQLLSEGCDRAIQKHPLAVPLAIGYVAAHLANVLPPSVDLLHQATRFRRG